MNSFIAFLVFLTNVLLLDMQFNFFFSHSQSAVDVYVGKKEAIGYVPEVAYYCRKGNGLKRRLKNGFSFLYHCGWFSFEFGQ